PPDYVFFGDSMLYTRIAPARLSALLGGRRVRLFATGGSGSALWYLQLRNYVVASGSHPERVFIFFRDRDLTAPTDNVDGPNRAVLERASADVDPAYESIMAANRSLVDRTRDLVAHVYPARRYQEAINVRVRRAALWPLLGPGETESEAFEAINGLF